MRIYINSVVSYKDSWKTFSISNQSELEDILCAIGDFVDAYIKLKHKKRKGDHFFINIRELWDIAILKNKGWYLPSPIINIYPTGKFNIRNLGPIKDGVCTTIATGGINDFLSRWLFQQSTVAIRAGIIKLPILILPTEEFSPYLDENRPLIRANTLEHFANQLDLIAPLSHNYPFLILGYSDRKEEILIKEIEADPLVAENNKIIERSIEFPSEYHQAGLNILNFFGTYLREQYPNENAKVKIEQHGLIVRLIIESHDGKSEVIEKALHEYQLIISGAQPPEAVVNNEKLVLEIRNELRIAKYRIESQQDIINSQNTQIGKLFKIVELGLVNKSIVNIDFRPNISTSSTININQDISNALNDISELKNLVPNSSDTYIVLKDLEVSMEAVEKVSDPEIVKSSSAMRKFKKFIEKASDVNTDIGKAIKVAGAGWETFKTLAGNYNKIAQWCGLPQVPTIFTK